MIVRRSKYWSRISKHRETARGASSATSAPLGFGAVMEIRHMVRRQAMITSCGR